MTKKVIPVLIIGLLLFSMSAYGSITVNYTVDGKDQPWLWVNGGLNTSYQYGVLDGTSPVSVGTSDGFAFNTGDMLSILYQSGTVSAGGGFISTGAGGDVTHVFNDALGSSGKYAPSKYMSSTYYPAYLIELVGAWVDGTGAIVAQPFEIGVGGGFTIPSGASHLYLGVNDDIFADNTGSFLISITGPEGSVTPPPGVVPEPATLLLLGAGLIGLAGYGRKKLN